VQLVAITRRSCCCWSTPDPLRRGFACSQNVVLLINGSGRASSNLAVAAVPAAVAPTILAVPAAVLVPATVAAVAATIPAVATARLSGIFTKVTLTGIAVTGIAVTGITVTGIAVTGIPFT
jgi:hypothetical protein